MEAAVSLAVTMSSSEMRPESMASATSRMVMIFVTLAGGRGVLASFS